MHGEYQGELFEEFKEKEGSLKRISKKILPKRRPHVLQVPLENIIIFAILVILGFIIFFALGVEKGKRQLQVASQEEEGVILKTTVIRPQPEIEKTELEKPPPVKKIEKPYTIQLISYTDEKSALEKVRQLKAKGIESSIIKSDKWFQVCAGSYVDKEDAQSDLNKFSKEYRGCFLRNK